MKFVFRVYFRIRETEFGNWNILWFLTINNRKWGYKIEKVRCKRLNNS